MRIILGALTCTRIEHLQIFASFPPLFINRKIQLLEYAIRTLSNPLNPNYHLIKDASINVNDFSIGIKPTSQRILYAFNSIPTQLREHIGILPLYTKYQILPKIVNSDIHINTKENYDSSKWKSLYNSLISQFPNYTLIFTDGSVK